jgi:uncharacterized membrane protein YebE (DUF533 family)
MEVERPNAKEPTAAELQDLDKLKAIIERAVADGVISSSEVKAIKTQAWTDGKITPQELGLYQQLVLSKIRDGELEWSFDT